MQDYENVGKPETTHQKISINILLYRLLRLKEKNIIFKNINISLKKEVRWVRIQSVIDQHLANIMQLSELIGVESHLLKSHLRSNFQKFVDSYFSKIQMMETYLKNERNHNP